MPPPHSCHFWLNNRETPLGLLYLTEALLSSAQYKADALGGPGRWITTLPLSHIVRAFKPLCVRR